MVLLGHGGVLPVSGDRENIGEIVVDSMIYYKKLTKTGVYK
jgi:hypothetical protein